MKNLLTKLETLVDEAIGLVREERQRRALQFMTAPPGPTVNPQPWQPLQPNTPIGPGWEITCVGKTLAYQRPIDNACAPNPFVGSAVWVGMTGPQSAESH